MSFGDVIRSTGAPSTFPDGIGGDTNTIWHCDYDSNSIYELNVSDFSVIRSAPTPTTVPRDIGGDANTIWHCTTLGDFLYELSTSDLSVVRSAPSPRSYPSGIGGDHSTIWHSDDTDDINYELNVSDFSVIRSAPTPRYYAAGIGGDVNTIWHTDYDVGTVYELSTSDLSVVRSASSPSYIPQGMGGDDNTIWHSDVYTDRIYELESTSVPPTYTISGNVKNFDGINLNNVTITLEDGTDYSTSTDISGNYSQVVDPAVYTVTASLAGYLNGSASVDASSGDQTQNFTLLKPVVSGNVTNGLGQNLEDITITFTDDVSYETTTDANGDYTQTVDADVYDVVASLMGNPDQSASVDASSSDKTQDFVFPITIAPHDKGIRLKSRYLVED